MSRLGFAAPFVVVAAIAAASLATVPAPAAAQSDDDFVPVTDAMLQDPDPADWPMWRRTLDGWGFRWGCLVTY
jgi:alcohol dehydrogenase (cytochrome c)